jgi:hypothetical protein
MWQKYFKVVKVVPGPVIIPGYGKIDLSSPNLPLSLVQELFEKDCPYLQITPQGIEHIYNMQDNAQSDAGTPVPSGHDETPVQSDYDETPVPSDHVETPVPPDPAKDYESLPKKNRKTLKEKASG